MTPNPQDSAVALEVERAIREALDAETTRGPWQAKRLANYNEPGWVILWPDNTKPGTHMRRLDYAGNVTEADAHLIAACNPEAMRSLLAEIDRLRASQEDGTSGWQPIETIPETGNFLVYMPDERTPIQVAKWHPNVKTIGNSFAFDLTAPTHWMPLPAAPAAKPQGDKSHE